jgi:hypothetical protein
MHQRCCVADRRTMRLIARLQPASKPPATKPHIATGLGRTTFLVKPFDPVVLLDKAKALLS